MKKPRGITPSGTEGEIRGRDAGTGSGGVAPLPPEAPVCHTTEEAGQGAAGRQPKYIIPFRKGQHNTTITILFIRSSGRAPEAPRRFGRSQRFSPSYGTPSTP